MNYSCFLSSLQETSYVSVNSDIQSPIFKENFFDIEELPEDPLSLSFTENVQESNESESQDWLFLSDPISNLSSQKKIRKKSYNQCIFSQQRKTAPCKPVLQQEIIETVKRKDHLQEGLEKLFKDQLSLTDLLSYPKSDQQIILYLIFRKIKAEPQQATEPSQLNQLFEWLQQTQSQKRVEEEFKFVIKSATKNIKRQNNQSIINNRRFLLDFQDNDKTISEPSTKNGSVIFKTNFAYEKKLQAALKDQGITDTQLFDYLSKSFIKDQQNNLSNKLSQFYTKLSGMKQELEELGNQEQSLKAIYQEIVENKKFKLPWTLAESQKALQNVLRKFE